MFTTEQLIAAGGREWNGHRVYFNQIGELAGLELIRGRAGQVSSGKYRGEFLSNNKIRGLAAHFDSCKLYYDVAEGKFCGTGFNDDEFNTVVTVLRARLEARQ